MKWFKHDSDAQDDAKLKRVRLTYGMEGYGLYWMCLEKIARNVTREKLTFELEEDSELLAHDTGLSRQKVEEMMRYMVDLGLFATCATTNRITCLKMLDRMDSSMVSNPLMRKAIQSAKTNSHDGVMTGSCQKIEDRTEDRSNGDKPKRKRFTPPTLEEVAAYCKGRGNGIDAQRFLDYYEARGWDLGKGRKVKCWKACVRTWEQNHTGRPSANDVRDWV